MKNTAATRNDHITLGEFLKEYETEEIHLLTHTDLDGYAAAAVMIKLLDLIGFNTDNITVRHTSPAHTFTYNAGLQIVTDLSWSSGDNLINAHDFLNASAHNRLWWYDHHITSRDSLADLMSDHPDTPMETVPGNIGTDECATMHVWKVYEYLRRIGEDGLKDIYLDELDQAVNYYWGKNPVNPPKSVTMVNDWDIFLLQDEDSKYFNTAFYHSPVWQRNPKSRYFQSYFLDENPAMVCIDHSMQWVDLTAFLVSQGKQFFTYQQLFFLNALSASGWIGYLNAPLKGLSGMEFICIDRVDMNFTIAAPTITHFFGRAMTVSHCGNELKYTLYDRVDGHPEPNAATICKAYGGGGHPGCAGMRLPINTPVFDHTAKLLRFHRDMIRADINTAKKNLAVTPREAEITEFLLS